MFSYKELKVFGYYKSYSQIEHATLAAKQKCVDTYLDLHFLGTSDTQINPDDNTFTFISQIKYNQSSFDNIRKTFEDALVRNGCKLMIQRYRSTDIVGKSSNSNKKWWEFWK